MNNPCFVFGDAQSFAPVGSAFRVRIPAGIQSKIELLRVWREQCHFPGYAGENWDAFADCLTDLSWLGEDVVVVVHEDLPLQGAEREQRIYIDVLHQAALDWQRAPIERNGDKTKHSLFFIFPAAEERKVKITLGAVE
jgi:hypothetical protein